MTTYDFQCPRCDTVKSVIVKMSQYDSIKNSTICDHCDTGMNRVFLSAAVVNMGWDAQAAGNDKKYWGSKPIVPLTIPKADGSGVNVIGDPQDL